MVKISPVHVPFLFYTSPWCLFHYRGAIPQGQVFCFLFYTSPWCLFHRLDTIEHVSTCVDGITTEGTYSRFCSLLARFPGCWRGAPARPDEQDNQRPSSLRPLFL